MVSEMYQKADWEYSYSSWNQFHLPAESGRSKVSTDQNFIVSDYWLPS